MSKTLTVATEVQKQLFLQVLLPEIQGGFWKNVRPADHADAWIGVSIVVNDKNLGAVGFTVPRNYNFVNPEFLKKNLPRLIKVAQAVNENETEKKVKKQLISLSRVVGDRLKEIGGPVRKLNRGTNKRAASTTTNKGSTKVVRAPATIVEPAQMAGGGGLGQKAA